MKNNASIPYTISLIIGDFLALIGAFGGAFLLRVTLDSRPIPYSVSAISYLELFLTLLPFWILVFGLLGLYTNSIYEKRFQEIGRLLIGSFIGMMFAILWEYFTPTTTIFPAHAVPLYGLGLAFIFLVIFRTIARLIRSQLFGYNHGLTHILVVGNTAMSRELLDWLADTKHSGYKVIGVVGGKIALGRHTDIRLYHSFNEFLEQPARKLHQIIQTELYADDKKNQIILNYAQTHHIEYKFVPGNTELFVGNLEVELFRSSIPMIAVHQTPLLGWGQVAKRLFDLAAGGLLLLLAAPVMLVIGLINRLAGAGIFFRQIRLTRFNHEFNVYKFQTVKNAYNGLSPEEAFQKMGRPELIRTYRDNGDQLPDDPRFGAWGRFLRRTSLDELPQLLNVVKGDISLVGPRALVPKELSVYEKRHAILSVKSGLTGLAQVSGRRNISFDERRTLDIYYVQNWTFWLDVTILLKTVKTVLAAKEPTSLRVAIVHDWLVGGGAERVVFELHRMYPEAPIYTSYCTDEWRQKLDGKVVTGWLQHFGRLRKFMALGRIWWFTHLDFTGYDLVISSSGNGEAKSIRLPSDVKHICYCHAPTHYYWRHYDQYLARPGFGMFDWLARLGLRALVGPLRRWDRQRASRRPDVFIANSTHTAREIHEFYDRDSTVIHPPVDIARFAVPAAGDRHGFITVGRQTSYKTDVIIEACNQLQLPLLVVGRGPEHDRLKALAGPTVTVRDDVTDEELPHLVAASRGFIFAAFEDFGIAPVEALAAGTPLIAYRAGGALDYVDDTTGMFFSSQTAEALKATLVQFQTVSYDVKKLQRKAAEFSPEAFRRHFSRFLERLPEAIEQ